MTRDKLTPAGWFKFWNFASSAVVCTSAPYRVTQIAAGRSDEGNEEKDELG